MFVFHIAHLGPDKYAFHHMSFWIAWIISLNHLHVRDRNYLSNVLYFSLLNRASYCTSISSKRIFWIQLILLITLTFKVVAHKSVFSEWIPTMNSFKFNTHSGLTYFIFGKGILSQHSHVTELVTLRALCLSILFQFLFSVVSALQTSIWCHNYLSYVGLSILHIFQDLLLGFHF